MKFSLNFSKTNQKGFFALHTILPLALVVMAVGGVGAYVLNKSGASSAGANGGLTGRTYDSAIDAGWTSIASPDLDGNGNDEIAFYNRANGKFLIYEGSMSSIGTNLASLTGISAGWDSVLGADLDGNKNDEFVFYRKSDGKMMIYEGSTSGLSTKLADISGISAGWDNVTAGDLDGNGNDELIFYRKSDGQFLIYEGSKTGIGTRLATVSGVTNTWDTVTTADLDGNGNDELIFYRKSDGKVLVYEGATNALGTKRADFNISANWGVVSSANLDGDKNDELQFYNNGTGKLMMYQGIDYSAGATTAVTTPAPTTTKPAAPTAATIQTVTSTGTFKCTNLKLLGAGPGAAGYAVTATNTGKTPIDISKYSFVDNLTQKQALATFTGTKTTGTQAINTPVTLGFAVTNNATSWSLVYNGTDKAPCVKPGQAAVSSVVVPVTNNTGGGAGSSTNGGASAPEPPKSTDGPVPKKDTKKSVVKISSMGYTIGMRCVVGIKGKPGVFKNVNCADATKLIMPVSGTQAGKVLKKDSITYSVGVAGKGDDFGKVNGCQKVTIQYKNVSPDYPCAVVFSDKSFFRGVSDSIKNRLNKIVGKADKGNGYVNAKEAKAAINQLKRKDVTKKVYKVTLSAKDTKTNVFVAQTITGKLAFDVNEDSYITAVKREQIEDCINTYGGFGAWNPKSKTCNTNYCNDIGKNLKNGNCVDKPKSPPKASGNGVPNPKTGVSNSDCSKRGYIGVDRKGNCYGNNKCTDQWICFFKDANYSGNVVKLAKNTTNFDLGKTSPKLDGQLSSVINNQPNDICLILAYNDRIPTKKVSAYSSLSYFDTYNDKYHSWRYC